MKVINVYERYFEAECTANGIPRRAADVMLTATSEEGTIRYEAAVSFFPFRDPEDFLISSDAYYSKELYFAKGRRSKKREEGYLKIFEAVINELAQAAGGKVFWDKPLIPERRG